MKILANQIGKWLIEYAVKANRKAWVVGVSGGVDSALVSTLCAMTGLPTHVVVLPCGTKADQTERGNKHIGWLEGRFSNINRHTINLSGTFDKFFEDTCVHYSNELAYANTKSRLRMIALYQIATCVGGLVVGTGNKVEDFGVGFFTKYGDGGVDISPIANLLKSEVRQMCRDLDVLPELSEAVPTDGLWNDTRTDEAQLGATYDELEWAMGWRYHTISESSYINIITPRQKEVLAIYDKWHNAGLHKLAPIPTFIR
jgi:NAD+ synthase